MNEILNIGMIVAGIALLVLALWLPLRLLSCLFSARVRQAVRRRWLLHLVWTVFSLAFLGVAVLTAVGPAHYAARAKVHEGLAIASAAKTGVAERWEQTGTLARSNEEAGIAPPREMVGTYVESVTVTADGSVVIRYTDSTAMPDEARGRSLVLVPQPGERGLTWTCSGGDMPDRLRPASCREP